jgi:16S rRNA (adenine1518-N6/adenine1519-N6)-dimethyltransferase
MPVRPKKGLGQHFLRNRNIARKIVDSLDMPPSGSILEVGAGTGILTGYLLEKYPRLYVIEIDREAWEFLQGTFPGDRDRILLGDFLKSDLPDELPAPLAIIGNFPYNISSQIFFRILSLRQKVEQVVCMIQREVADRIRAPHGSRTYGILSVLLQAWYGIEYLFPVSPGVFNPPPKVRSAVLRLKRNGISQLPCDEDLFFKVVKTAFNQRRKTLRNSLKGHFTIPDPGMDLFGLRPEQLSVEGFVELTQLLGPGLYA